MAVVAALAVAGCGTSAPPLHVRAARCLQNVLDDGKPTASCRHGRTFDASPGSLTLAKPTNAAGQVACIRQVGNQYVCQDGNGNQYDVTYDGTHIAYQQAP